MNKLIYAAVFTAMSIVPFISVAQAEEGFPSKPIKYIISVIRLKYKIY